MTPLSPTYPKTKSNLEAINACTYETTHRHSSHAVITSEEMLQEELADCIKNGQPFHVSSKGKNWGYGSRLGHENQTKLIDLSYMRQVEVHEKHGYVIIEAGASQQDVYDQLKASNSGLMLPVTGSSADSSVLGNAMGLGYANGRHTVRFEHILQANGFTQESGFIEGIDDSTCKYRHQSPTQKLLRGGRKSIISKIKLHLPSIPEYMVMFAFSINEEAQFEPLVQRLIDYEKQGLIEGNWSVFSAHRLLAERNRKIDLMSSKDDFISYQEAQEILEKKYAYKTWKGRYNGVFACYLPSEGIAESIKAFVSQDLTPLVDTLDIIGVNREDILAERNEGNGFAHIQADAPVISRLRTFAGILQNGSIDIAYWKKDQLSNSLDLDQDKCGFIWLAISSPNDEQMLNQAKEIINASLFEYEIDPIFVVDGALAHESYLMLSLIFDKSDMDQSRLYGRAFKELQLKLEEAGMVNYRMPVPIS